MPWDMRTLNVSATLNIFRVFANPSLCLPHATISTFNDLPIPLNKAFEKHGEKVDIKAVVLDKDDCFATPHSNEVYEPYRVRHYLSYDWRAPSLLTFQCPPITIFLVVSLTIERSIHRSYHDPFFWHGDLQYHSASYLT